MANHSFLLTVLFGLALSCTTAARAQDVEQAWVAFERGEYASAREVFVPLAHAGHAEAQFGMGLLHEFGRGAPLDDATAAEWYRRAAEQGEIESHLRLAIVYGNGWGSLHDYAEAARWLRRAADLGDSEGQYLLGEFYQYGLGVARDDAEAQKWFGEAAVQGHPRAVRQVAKAHVRKKRPLEALEWYRHAATMGLMWGFYEVASAHLLGNAFCQCDTMPQDLILAYMWFDLAALAGDTNAALNRDVVARRMTKAEIAEGKRQAELWLHEHR